MEPNPPSKPDRTPEKGLQGGYRDPDSHILGSCCRAQEAQEGSTSLNPRTGRHATCCRGNKPASAGELCEAQVSTELSAADLITPVTHLLGRMGCEPTDVAQGHSHMGSKERLSPAPKPQCQLGQQALAVTREQRALSTAGPHSHHAPVHGDSPAVTVSPCLRLGFLPQHCELNCPLVFINLGVSWGPAQGGDLTQSSGHTGLWQLCCHSHRNRPTHSPRG